MKLNVNQSLFNIKGNVLLDDENKPVILKNILINTTLSEVDKEEDKLANFKLAMKVENAKDELELSTEELSKLQQKIRKLFNALIVGQVFEILEGRENPLKPIKNEDK